MNFTLQYESIVNATNDDIDLAEVCLKSFEVITSSILTFQRFVQLENNTIIYVKYISE